MPRKKRSNVGQACGQPCECGTHDPPCARIPGCTCGHKSRRYQVTKQNPNGVGNLNFMGPLCVKCGKVWVSPGEINDKAVQNMPF